jgi:endonuclease/exonuclease/phosphatase family metal-dependent hydrolase
MTYNIHSGYSEAGRHNPQEIANVIRNANADIVGIQEISRGWMIDGSTDLFAYLQRELDMPYATFSATADPVWGNAILSRYPIVATESAPLPQFDTRIPRGYVGATIDLGNNNQILLLTTHLHHRADNLTQIHLAQLDTILTAWDKRSHTILVGDMNAQPGWEQTDLVLNNGFVDSWAEVGVGAGLTTENRIDWVFHTPDLTATQAKVITSSASDHFPIAVKISLR